MTSGCIDNIYVPITIREDDLFGGILNVLAVIRPNWTHNSIKFKVFTDGITNKLVGCQFNDSSPNNDSIVLVRVYGNKTDLLIDRKAELRNIKKLHEYNLAPEVYGVFENGLAYQYYPGSILDIDTVHNPKIWPLVARHMAKIHNVNFGLEVSREPMVWDKIEQFLNLLPEKFSEKNKQDRFIKSFGSVSKLRIEYERLKSYLSKSASPVVFAHNDLLLGNVVYNKDEHSISFIDYEYAAYNYQAFDIANHFNEFVGITIEDIDYDRYPSQSFQRSWIATYLSEFLNVTDVASDKVELVRVQVEQMSLASHFLWGVWSLVQYELSNIDFDFGSVKITTQSGFNKNNVITVKFKYRKKAMQNLNQLKDFADRPQAN